jgi:hypothetical protein
MLFNNISEVKEFLPVNVALEFNSIKPFIKISERNYIIKLIGAGMFNEIAGYSELTDVSAKQKELQELCKIADINIAMWRWSNIGALQVGDVGITRAETEMQKSAFKYQEDALREGFKTDGFNGLDDLLEYLELNITTFQTFKASANYTVFKGHLINQTTEFNSIYFIGGSRLVFIRLQQFIKQAEDFDIIPLIGKTLYDRVIAIIQNQGSGSGSGSGSGNSVITDLIMFLKQAVAYRAVFRGIVSLNFNITDKGFFFESKEGGSSSFAKQTNVNETFNLNGSLEGLAINSRDIGSEYMEQARKHLLAYPDDFPEYTNSSAFDDGAGVARMRFNNTDKKTVRM